MANRKRLQGIMDRFAGMRILVLGDLMLDEHIWGEVGRISPEAPVIVVDAQERECRPGGAANVVNNVRALGAQASVIGIVGDDEYGRELIELLATAGVDVSGVVIDRNRPTTRKTRIWASHRQQVARVDWESRDPVRGEISDEICRHLSLKIESCDAVVLSDYDKGALVPEVISRAVEKTSSLGKICTSNPKPVRLNGFCGMTAVTLNLSEAEAAVGRKIPDEGTLAEAGFTLIDQLCARSLIITRGAKGLALFEPGYKVSHIPAMATEVYDVAGAGDTVISTLTLALAGGATPFEAAVLANAAGGSVVRKVGVATTTIQEISALLDGFR